MKEHTGKNKIFIVIIICLCAVIIAGLIYFMKLKGGSDSAFKPDLDSNAKTQTADDTGEKPTGIRIPGYPSITIEADKKDVQMNLMNPEGNPCYFTFAPFMAEPSVSDAVVILMVAGYSPAASAFSNVTSVIAFPGSTIFDV